MRRGWALQYRIYYEEKRLVRQYETLTVALASEGEMKYSELEDQFAMIKAQVSYWADRAVEDSLKERPIKNDRRK